VKQSWNLSLSQTAPLGSSVVEEIGNIGPCVNYCHLTHQHHEKRASTTNLQKDPKRPAPKPVEHPVLEERDPTSEAEGKERGDTKSGLEDPTATDLANDIESNAQSGGQPLSVDASGTEPDVKSLLESVRGRRYADSKSPKGYIQGGLVPMLNLQAPFAQKLALLQQMYARNLRRRLSRKAISRAVRLLSSVS